MGIKDYDQNNPELEEFQRIYEYWKGFAYFGIRTIVYTLMTKHEFDKEKVKRFGEWYIRKGLSDGWLLYKLGFE